MENSLGKIDAVIDRSRDQICGHGESVMPVVLLGLLVDSPEGRPRFTPQEFWTNLRWQ